MPWRVGIDEAGYGPNLGPLVMTAVACHVPDEHADADLWAVLSKAVRRHGDRKRRQRLFIDDSKLVYSTARGLAELETSVLGILLGAGAAPACLATLVDLLHPDHDLPGEAWYCGTSALPLTAEAEDIAQRSQTFRTTCDDAQVQWRVLRSVIVSPPRFNALIDRWGTKGAALGLGLTQLLQAAVAPGPAEPVSVVVDKHGGRNRYGSLLEEALPGVWALPRDEGMDQSIYDVMGLDRPVRVTFRPRADSGSFEVALASMISKYVREALMAEFNRFWQQHVADLTPTAGYPGDAARFLEAIRPALVRLQIAEELVWRKR